jgi:hypothetical protein
VRHGFLLELGVSLMIDDDGKLRFVFLFLALIYWGLNNWRSARLGIYAALENGDLGVVPAHPTPDKPNRRVVDGKDRWLFWPPRLLGVCAHLFAAINLSLAAWRQPDFALLAWTAPFGIIVFTALVYVFDRYALSERTPGARSILAGFASIAFAVFFLLAIAVFAYIQPATLSRFHSAVWSRFLWGTFTISLSAFTLLIGVSILGMRKPLGPEASEKVREADDRREASARARWTLGLFAPAFVIALSVWISAPFVGRALGSMVVALFRPGSRARSHQCLRVRCRMGDRAQLVRRGGETLRRRGDRCVGLSECMATSVPSGASLRRRRLPCAGIGRRLSPSPRRQTERRDCGKSLVCAG